MSDATIKRVLPFSITVVIESVPKVMGTQQGYQHTAKAFSTINGKQIDIKVSEWLGWSGASYLSSLKFYVTVDGSALVPLINKQNRE